MAKNLKKFVNPQFNDTVPLPLLRRLLERHPDAIARIDVTIFDRDPTDARRAVLDYLRGPEAFPEELIADLYRIAEIGTRQGLDILLPQFRRAGVAVPGAGPGVADPKEVALRALLDHPDIFDAAESMLALWQTAGIAEFAGLEEGVEADITSDTVGAFEHAAGRIFEASLHGDYCRVLAYEDEGEIVLTVSHGTPITTTTVVREGSGHPIALQTIDQAILAYSATEGRLKMAGVAKGRRDTLAEAFAHCFLGKPGFFRGPDAMNLYTLSPVERGWPEFRVTHAFDRRIRNVRIVEAQVDRVSRDLFGVLDGVEWSFLARDGKECALARLAASRPEVEFGSGDWRIGHIVLRVRIDTGRRVPASVTVKVKPQATASFKRHRFEAQIVELLRRNGFCRDRDDDLAPVAAE